LPRRGFAALFPHHTKKILINVAYLLYAPPPPPPPPVKRLKWTALSLFLSVLHFGRILGRAMLGLSYAQ
jgi:hypothetical protein